MPEKDPVIELLMPSFLMPPLDLRHADRVSQNVKMQMFNVSARAWFPRRTVRIRALRNVYVADEGLVIHQDLALESCTVRGHNEGRIARARDAIVKGRANGTIGRIEGDVVLCRSFGAWNYGHWLIEMLPMAYAAAKHWPHSARFLLQAVNGHLRDVIREAYERLGIPASQRIECGSEPVLVEMLVIVEGLAEHGNYIAPLVMECLDDLSASIAPDPNKKLFASRGKSPTRLLPREPSLALRLMADGFVCLAPGSASLEAQIAAFKGGRRIVGVIGAAMTNLAFSQNGAEVIMLSPAAMPDTFFWFICGLRGIHLIDLRCRNKPSIIGNREWDGPLDLDQRDEDEIVASASAPVNAFRAASPDLGVLFDAQYYLANYGASVPADADPLEHFFKAGWREGYDPSAYFSTSFYLDTYPDVATSGVNPLVHYIIHGCAEGRLPTNEDNIGGSALREKGSKAS